MFTSVFFCRVFSRASIAAFFASAFLQMGCSVALGPGFGHAARGINLASSPNQAEGVRVQVTDRLVNAGNRGLSFLDVTLPAAGELKVSVDGREEAAAPVSAAAGAPMRVRFDPAWAQRQARSVAISYELRPEFSSGGVVGATTNGLYLTDQAALPRWLAPQGLFAKGAAYSRTRSIAVTVPPEFRVLASGSISGSRGRTTREGALVRREFRLSKPDEPAYLVAGKYLEQRAAMGQWDIVFWTFAPIDAVGARTVAARLADTAATFEQTFGPLQKGRRSLYLVEVDGSSISSRTGESYGGIDGAPFPGGVLVDRGEIGGFINEPVLLGAAEYELARSWFGWRGQPDEQSSILLGPGISLFAVALAAEARGGAAARQEEIARLLADYDYARRAAADGPLLNVPAEASVAQRQVDAYRAALFFAALEDLAGRDHFAEALRRFWTDMASQQLSADELRSALEAATDSNLADVFRTWLDHPGVPDDFRRRYAANSQAAN